MAEKTAGRRRQTAVPGPAELVFQLLDTGLAGPQPLFLQ